MKLSEYEYNLIIKKLAREAAESHVKLNKSMGIKPVEVKKKDRFNPEPKPAGQAYFDEYVRRIKKAYPYDTITNEQIDDLEKFTGDQTLKWLDFGGMSPSEFAKSVEAAKFLPLLQGRSDDPNEKNWYNMGLEELKKNAVDIGWDPRTKEGFAEFLDKVAEYQNLMDRAKITKELHDNPWYGINAFFHPSATQEIENVIATGEGGDLDKIKRLGYLDAGVNSLMFGLPGLRGAKIATPNPFGVSKTVPWITKITKGNEVATPMAEAVLQGVVEGGRQGGKVALSETGQEASPGAIVAASTLGATRPAIVTTGQTALRKVPSETVKEFAAGFGRANKAGDPVLSEAARLRTLIGDYNSSLINQRLAKSVNEIIDTDLARDWAKLSPSQRQAAWDLITKGKDDKTKSILSQVLATGGKSTGISRVDPLAQAKKMQSASDAPRRAKLLGVEVKPGQQIDADAVLNNYLNRPFHEVSDIGETITIGKNAPSFPVRTKDGRDVIVLDAGNEEMYKAAFPSKFQADLEATGPNRYGLWWGNRVGDFGTRFEPTFKVDPISPIKDWFNDTPKGEEYKNEDWYKNLSEESQKIVDEAFKKKAKK